MHTARKSQPLSTCCLIIPQNRVTTLFSLFFHSPHKLGSNPMSPACLPTAAFCPASVVQPSGSSDGMGSEVLIRWLGSCFSGVCTNCSGLILSTDPAQCWQVLRRPNCLCATLPQSVSKVPGHRRTASTAFCPCCPVGSREAPVWTAWTARNLDCVVVACTGSDTSEQQQLCLPGNLLPLKSLRTAISEPLAWKTS